VTPAMQKNLGLGMALISVIGLCLGICLACLAITLQAIDPGGFSNNLTGFVVIFGLCPLPLMVISGVCLLIGLAAAFFARGGEA